MPIIMGIVNVTPDSFSDGGSFVAPTAAIDHALRLEAEGAGVLDVGAESTRPGASPIDEEEEWRRLEPVLKGLNRRAKVMISVDTYRVNTARRAIDHGATMVNDVWAARYDETPNASPMLALAATTQVQLCLMHMLGEPRTMQAAPVYDDVVGEVSRFLRARVEAAVKAGVARERLWIDPGFGFGKAVEHNCELVRRVGEFVPIAPVLVGLSRKSSLAKISGTDDPMRLPESLGGAMAAWMNGASVLRVHDVGATVRALRVLGAMV